MLPVLALLLSFGLHPDTTGDDQGCLPWSVLAAQQGFSEQLQSLKPAPKPSESGEANKTGSPAPDLGSPETMAPQAHTSPFPLENLCRTAAAGMDDMGVINFWNRLGPLRLQPGVGVPLLMRIAQTPHALDYIVRLPSVGGWPVAAQHFASGAFDRLSPVETEPGPDLNNLKAAAQRWPDLARRWLSMQRPQDQQTPRYQAIVGAIGLLDDSPEPAITPEGAAVVPLILPNEGRGARTGRAIQRFLRIYSALANWDLVLSVMVEETASPERMANLEAKGANIVGIVGPLIRKNLNPWLASDKRAQPIVFQMGPSDTTSIKSGVWGLGPQLRDQLRAHASQQSGKLLEPLLVIGPPGSKIEKWRIAADDALEVDKNPKSIGAMVLTYDPREADLSAFAEFVRQAAPQTLVLAVPHSDADRVLRYLASAGVRAHRKGKKPHANELHPVIIGPSSFGLDPSLKKRNRDYLDGVRIASDMPMIADWQELPGVQQYVQEVGAYPPIAALRIAAALDRVQARHRSKQSVGADTASEWISGDTMMGRLEMTEGSLIFPLQVYMYFGDRFSPVR